jgi:hypothetical protein
MRSNHTRSDAGGNWRASSRNPPSGLEGESDARHFRLNQMNRRIALGNPLRVKLKVIVSVEPPCERFAAFGVQMQNSTPMRLLCGTVAPAQHSRPGRMSRRPGGEGKWGRRLRSANRDGG